jgi:hypothetical protein
LNPHAKYFLNYMIKLQFLNLSVIPSLQLLYIVQLRGQELVLMKNTSLLFISFLFVKNSSCFVFSFILLIHELFISYTHYYVKLLLLQITYSSLFCSQKTRLRCSENEDRTVVQTSSVVSQIDFSCTDFVRETFNTKFYPEK